MSPSRRTFIAQMAAAALAPVPLQCAHAMASRAGRSYWQNLRGEFLLPEDEAYFNAATLGAQPRVVLATVVAHMQHVERDLAHWDYKPGHEQFYSGYYPELSVREKIAQFINAKVAEIALTENATSGMNMVANGLDLSPGDEVVMLDRGHIGSRCGWELKAKRSGVVIRDVKLPVGSFSDEQMIELYEASTNANTRVWVIEHLTSATAIRFPVNELCKRARERGIFTIVDGAQSCGHLPVDVAAMRCDAFYTSASKWMMAPRGISFLYVQADAQPRIWTTLASEHWDDHENGAFRFMQRGSTNRSLVRGLETAIDFYNRIGAAAVQRRIMELATRFRAGLEECSRARIVSPHVSGTTTFEVEGYDGVGLQDALWERARVRVRRQGNAVRLCCHVWNSEEEVDRAVRTTLRLKD
jgi:isopenicillin-N epimerase